MCDCNCSIKNILLSICFSIFGMLLIFGLGFVFPTINPYIVIKWIIIVCSAVFAYAVIYMIISLVKTLKFGKGKKGARK
jgi:hypothetical protein